MHTWTHSSAVEKKRMKMWYKVKARPVNLVPRDHAKLSALGPAVVAPSSSSRVGLDDAGTASQANKVVAEERLINNKITAVR